MTCRDHWAALGLAVIFALPLSTPAQDTANSAVATAPRVTADYPRDRAGILIHSSEWVSLTLQAPARTRAKHGLAPTFTYGVAPAAVVSEYEGVHAAVQIEPSRPVICICRLMGLPGNPALVRLHPKKTFRELDGGKIHYGSKTAEAEQNDLIPINVTQPEDTVWLVQPQQDLPAGEYALMAGTQNMAIFPFTVAAPANAPPAPSKK